MVVPPWLGRGGMGGEGMGDGMGRMGIGGGGVLHGGVQECRSI